MSGNNIFLLEHDISVLREMYPLWDTYTRKEKNFAARAAAPQSASAAHNVSCVGHHRLIPRLMNPEDTLRASQIDFRLAMGTNGAGGTSEADESLNQHAYEVSITDALQSGTEIQYSTFVDSNEANDNTIDEVGIVAVLPDETRELLNHATISSIVKDSSKTITGDVYLGYQA